MVPAVAFARFVHGVALSHGGEVDVVGNTSGDEEFNHLAPAAERLVVTTTARLGINADSGGGIFLSRTDVDVSHLASGH